MRIWMVLFWLAVGGASAEAGESLRPISQDRSIWATISSVCCGYEEEGCRPIELVDIETASDFGQFSQIPLVGGPYYCCLSDVGSCGSQSSHAKQYSTIGASRLEAHGSIGAQPSIATSWFFPLRTTCGSRFRVEFEVTSGSWFRLDALVRVNSLLGSMEGILGRIALMGDDMHFELESTGEEAVLREVGWLPAGRYVADATISIDSHSGGTGKFEFYLDIGTTGVRRSSWQAVKKLYQ